MTHPPSIMLGADVPYNRERVFRKYLLRGSERQSEQLDLHCVRTVHAGERVLIYELGVGGVGPAFERDPAAVAEDVRLGLVMPERARAEYGVVVDPTTFAVDATADLRAHDGPRRGSRKRRRSACRFD